jgi:HNH endonuclease
VTFDVAAALRKSTGRAKSDVANKLVSMFLHEVSRKACLAGGMSVTDPRYAESVLTAFGRGCLYCGAELERDRTSVEHLNGMNRVSVGLHVPGNVAMACKRCNNEKRQDDQLLPLAENGWESFLSHNGIRCAPNCKACNYWIGVWPDQETRHSSLASARERVHRFQHPFTQFVRWSEDARESLRQKIEILYRDCQRFATDEIGKLTLGLELDFSESKMLDVEE